MIKELKYLRELYAKNTNLMEYFKQQSNPEHNTTDMIRISYDFQAGQYIKKTLSNLEWVNEYTNALANVVNTLDNPESILEVGVGEATNLYYMLQKLSHVPAKIYCHDISYSRVRYAKHFLKNRGYNNISVFLGDLFQNPILDNSIDVVITSHALEPNGGREQQALQELYRIAAKYLVLFEPSYEFASKTVKQHICKHGYVKNLYETALDLKMNVVEHRLLFKSHPMSPMNNTSVIIIEKNIENEITTPFACPVTLEPLESIRNNYYCKKSMLLYPIVDNIPCLTVENAIIATHYLDDLSKC